MMEHMRTREGNAMEMVPDKDEKKVTEAVEDVKMSTEETLCSSLSSSDVVEIPLFWGSVLEGASDLKATYEQSVRSSPRVVSLSMFCEPYVMQLFRRAGALKVSRDAVAVAKKILVELIAKTCSPLNLDMALEKNNKHGQKKTRKAAVIGPEEVQVACRAWGFRLFGAQAIHATSCPYLDCVSLVNKKFNANAWTVLCHTLSGTRQMELNSIYTLLAMKKLVDVGRADALATNNPSVIAQACKTLDSYAFRYLLSFIVVNPRKTKYMKSYELFSENENLTDCWDSDVKHWSLEDALKANVDLLKAEDRHTGATLLHTFSARNRAEDCQKLIDMGMDTEVTTGDYFENGDGWGELEYVSFKALHFACSNGHTDVARVLLKNGARVDVHAGWDGGHHVPLILPWSDYFYTSRNTPLHQAARGNHVDIIHLLLDGPDDDSRAYAASKGIDLSAWTSINLEDNSPSIETYNTNRRNEINFDATPLGMALIFGNLDAAMALLQHGADLNNISDNANVLKRITRNILRNGSNFKSALKNALCRYPHAYEEMFGKYNGREGDDFEEEEEEEEEEEPWKKYGWDKNQVAAGDAIVLVKDDDDEIPGFLPEDECVFAESIGSMMYLCHSEKHEMSRNCQFALSDFFEYLVNSALTLIVTQHQSNLTTDAVRAIIPSLVVGNLVTFAMKEIRKVEYYTDAMYANIIQQHLDSHFPSIKCVNKGLLALSACVEYFVSDLLELTGSFSSKRNLKYIQPDHVFNIDDDEMEESFFKLSSYGTALRVCYKNCVIRDDGIYTDEKVNNDYFDQEWIEEKHLLNSVSEFTMCAREFRTAFKTSPLYGVSILPSVFQSVLGEQCRLSNATLAECFSEEGLLSVQVACESALVDIISNATSAWRARSEETGYTEFLLVTGDDIEKAYADANAVLQSRVVGSRF